MKVDPLTNGPKGVFMRKYSFILMLFAICFAKFGNCGDLSLHFDMGKQTLNIQVGADGSETTSILTGKIYEVFQVAPEKSNPNPQIQRTDLFSGRIWQMSLPRNEKNSRIRGMLPRGMRIIRVMSNMANRDFLFTDDEHIYLYSIYFPSVLHSWPIPEALSPKLGNRIEEIRYWLDSRYSKYAANARDLSTTDKRYDVVALRIFNEVTGEEKVQTWFMPGEWAVPMKIADIFPTQLSSTPNPEGGVKMSLDRNQYVVVASETKAAKLYDQNASPIETHSSWNPAIRRVWIGQDEKRTPLASDPSHSENLGETSAATADVGPENSSVPKNKNGEVFSRGSLVLVHSCGEILK